jgi:glycosyltransferase involved in cell wall biosynthesis
VPLEIVSHGADVRTLVGLPALVRRRAIAALLEDATSWRFVSQSLLDDLARSLSGREAERLAAMARVEPAALDMPDVRARSSERKALHIGPLYALVGRLVPSKRFDKALEALAARGSGRDGSRVVVVGDGPERGRLEAQARRLGLDAEFVGKTSREEAIAWIGASDALVHASRTEGLSTVVREAETLGVPVELVG